VLHTLPIAINPQYTDTQSIRISIFTVPHQQQAKEKMPAKHISPRPAPANPTAGASQQGNETLEVNQELILLRQFDIPAIHTKAGKHAAFNQVVDDIIRQFGEGLFSRLWLHKLRNETRREVARILATAPGLPEPSQDCKSFPNIVLKA
jgi:hypothetical protein